MLALTPPLASPLWKVTELFTGEKTRMKAASKVMDDFAFKIISQREKEGLGNITRDDKQDSTDLLSLYMALRDENGKPLSKRALRWVVSQSKFQPVRS